MPEFNNLNNLFNFIKEKIEESLKTDVAQTIKEVEREHVYKDVYSKYEPRRYERKMDDGGLSSIKNMDHDVKINGDSIELTITNKRTDEKTGKYIPYVVETGIGYDYTEPDYPNPPYTYQNPRPFTKETIKDLQQHKQHIMTLKRSLQKYMEVK
jgi:hypothetical protein